jgi:hypothetical protein
MASNSFIGIDIQGITTLSERLKKLPKEARDLGTESANEYIVSAMQVQPSKPTKPFQWSSEKQRRYVMMLINKGGYRGRTQELRNAWKTVGKGYNQIVANETPYAQFVQDTNQIIGHKANGWQTVNQVLKTRAKEILAKFDSGVKKALKKLNLN